MASEYHKTGSGTGYTLNSDGTVTRQGGSGSSPRPSSSGSNGNSNSSIWIILGLAVIGLIIFFVYRSNSYISFYNTSIDFSSSSTNPCVNVNSNRSWEISSSPASWAHVYKSGNNLNIRCDENTSTSSRETWVEVKCMNDQRARLRITQAAKPYLTISQSEVNFECSSSSYTFTVSSNESWSIQTGTASWGHLNRSGSSLVLTVDANPSTSDRTDYFILSSSSGIQARVNIKQKGVSYSNYNYSNANASIKKVWVDHNQTQNGKSGMKIHVNFDVNYMLNKPGQVAVYFYYSNGNPLKDKNNSYWTSDGSVAHSDNFTPPYEFCNYGDFVLFMPYSELHLSSDQSCYFTISIWGGNKRLTSGGKTGFNYYN